MNILIRDESDIRIFSFVNDEITDDNVDFMKRHIETMPKDRPHRYAVNLANIKKISKKFLEFIKQFKTMLCCLNTEFLTYCMLTRIVNTIKVYVTESDLIEDRRQVLKRDFLIY